MKRLLLILLILCYPVHAAPVPAPKYPSSMPHAVVFNWKNMKNELVFFYKDGTYQLFYVEDLSLQNYGTYAYDRKTGALRLEGQGFIIGQDGGKTTWEVKYVMQFSGRRTGQIIDGNSNGARFTIVHENEE